VRELRENASIGQGRIQKAPLGIRVGWGMGFELPRPRRRRRRWVGNWEGFPPSPAD